MKTFCEPMLSHITTAHTRRISSEPERMPRSASVTRGGLFPLFACSLLCACTSSPFGKTLVTESGTVQFIEQLPVRAVESGQSVLSWENPRTERIPASAALGQAQMIAMAPRRVEGLSGEWQGVLVQESGERDANMVALGRFLRVNLQQAGTTVTGSGEMSTGERLKISGTVEKGHSQGIVENVTYGIASRFVGTVADAEIVVHFTRGGGEADVHGVATLHRREN